MKRFYPSVAVATIAFLGCARSPVTEDNLPPEIRRLWTDDDPVPARSEVLLRAEVTDPEGDSLRATWRLNRGQLLSSSLDSARWLSPDSSAYVRWIYDVEDSRGNLSSDTLSFWVENRPPVIEQLQASQTIVLNGNTILLSGAASDPDSHAVDLRWSTPFGWLHAFEGDSVAWTVPDSTQRAWVELAAVDQYGATARDTLRIIVYREIGCAWILNEGAQEIVKLSSIGDELLRIDGFSDLQDIAIDPENRRFWVCEGTPPQLHAFDLRGSLLFSTALDFVRPLRLAPWPRTGSVFVLDGEDARVLEVGFLGERILRSIAGFRRPNALAVDSRSGTLWVSDEGAQSIYQIAGDDPQDIAQVDSSLVVLRHRNYPYPSAVAIEDSTGACWVADRELGALVRYEANGLDSLVVPGFRNPVALSAARTVGLCWVLDRGLDSRAMRIFYDQVQLDIGGLSFPKHLAYSRINAQCWVLDSERNRVLLLDPMGAVAGTWTDFDFPSRIVVNSGY
jgi:DNA-binding beta-propeller fold protein YncE